MDVIKVTLSDGYRIPELDANPQCCALVNLGDEFVSFPNTFYPEFRKGRVVVATSPDREHWSNFAHEHPANADMVMGPLYYGR